MFLKFLAQIMGFCWILVDPFEAKAPSESHHSNDAIFDDGHGPSSVDDFSRVESVEMRWRCSQVHHRKLQADIAAFGDWL